MSFAELFDGISKLGLGGIVFVIWYFDNRKIDGLQKIVQEQIEDKKLMREEREQLIRMVEENAKLMQRCATAMEKIERKLSAA